MILLTFLSVDISGSCKRYIGAAYLHRAYVPLTTCAQQRESDCHRALLTASHPLFHPGHGRLLVTAIGTAEAGKK